MKKTLSILIIALAFLSCEKEKAGPTHDTTPIEFGNVETRAAISSVDNMIDSGLGFGVFGYVSGAEDTPLLSNEKIYWENSMWTYVNTRYWIPDRTFQFFAYYPYDDETDATKPISNVAANGNGVGYQLAFTTPETADFDLLSAYKEVDTGADDFDGADPVSLHFDHEMVNLNLKIWRDGGKHQNDKIRVKEVALSNVTWSGTVTKAAGGSTTWTSTTRKPLLAGTVENPETEIGAATKTSDGINPGAGAVPCTPFGTNGLLLIPATISGANAVSLSIVYELQLQGADKNTWSEYSHNITLPATTWKAGTQITYNVLLSNIVDITFYYISTSVTSWGTPQVGGTIIIK